MMKIDNKAKIIILPETPKRVKKITGTRFAAILGLNPWSSPFEAWCDMTGTYKIPFEDSVYTIAGKVIEPKVIAYLDKKYHYGRHTLKGPDEYFGKTKEQLHFDHFPEDKVYGGMWDCRTKTIVYELKTTKRVEDWYKGGKLDAPIYYKMQGALYAYLLGLDRFRMVLTALEEKDYEHPEDFVPTPVNTSVLDYRISTEFPQFEAYIKSCDEWLENHVKTPVSPEWTTGKNDTEILKALTTAHAMPTDTAEGCDPVAVLLAQIEPLQAEVDALAEKEKQLDELKKQLKSELEKRMSDSDKKIVLTGSAYDFIVSRSSQTRVDTKALKADGLYDKYAKSSEIIKLNVERKVS